MKFFIASLFSLTTLSALISGNVVGIGKECGGGTRYANTCSQGLVCFYLRPMPGAKGECRPLAKLGERCGGRVPHPAVCDTGLACLEPRMFGPGFFGRCVKST